MHAITLPPDLRQKLRTIRGRDHIFETIDPARTAHLCIDMQNFFVAPSALMEIPVARAIVPNINRLAAALRHAGGLNIWVRVTLAEQGFGAWDSYFDRMPMPGKRDQYREALKPGAAAHEFWSELDITSEDLISDKTRFSAMIQGASELENDLGKRGIDTLIITGTLTNVCCESTARDAAMRDFKVIMVEDACAARTDEDHLAGLRTVVQVFGDVRTTGDVISLLG